jgi:5-methylcytosine-specific restriction protein B
MLDPRIVQELQTIQERLTDDGKLPPVEKLAQYYATFRDRFGPDRLRSLDGEPLLTTMHGLSRQNRDTLVYWLEFKNDDEFPGIFGSISGGSALKYGVYPNAQTGDWMGRNPSNYPVKISLDEAITIARKHREQLLRGVELLQQLPANGSDADYARLQQAMDEQAPDVSTVAWGHKYFSLLFPDKLDDYHVPNYQRFHLVRLLQPDLPPVKAGRYITAGRYVAIANELNLPINHLTTILNGRTQRPYRYWRVMANRRSPDGWKLWPLMQEKSIVAVGWDNVGDLSHLTYSEPSKAELSQLMKQHYNASNPWVTELFYFVTLAKPDDLVLAMEGDTVLGIGRITGPYQYGATAQGRHQRAVEWLSTEQWTLPVAEGKGSNWRGLNEYANQVAIEQRILDVPVVAPPPPPDTIKPAPPLTGITAQIHAILERKGQVILYGPPGTGKTFAALTAARELAARAAFNRPFGELQHDEKSQIQGGPGALVQLVTFHPGYGYEDFIEGYRPAAGDGPIRFVLRSGLFKQLAREAAQQPDRKYFLLIDEINRGDIPRIFGELLTLLEKDKRGQPLLLPVSGESFAVPANIFVIGTMNTADRSIALLDTALRRRFGFIELMPDYTLLADAVVEGIPLALWLQALNRRIVESIGRDARNLQIGHAYLMEAGKPITDFARLSRVVQEDIVPLLEEYSYEDYTALEQILGRSLVDATNQLVHHELFAAGRKADLIQALLEPTPDLTTTAQAVSAEEEPPDDTLDEEDADQAA